MGKNLIDELLSLDRGFRLLKEVQVFECMLRRHIGNGHRGWVECYLHVTDFLSW